MDLGAPRAVDLGDRVGDRPLEAALVGDLLLLAGGAELLLVEDLEAGLRRAELRPLEASATFADVSLPFCTADRRAAVLQLVRDPGAVSAAVICAVLAGSTPVMIVV